MGTLTLKRAPSLPIPRVNVRLVAIERLRAGMEVGRDLTTGRAHEAALLRAGVVLTDGVIDRLRVGRVPAIWVEDDLGEGIDPLPPLPLELREEAEQTVTNAFAVTAQAMARGQTLPREVALELGDLAQTIARSLASCPEAALALHDLAVADAYTHRHSIQVTVLGLLIARRHWVRNGWTDWTGRQRYDGIEERLARLGFGLLVHDLGKLFIPSEILNKPGRLTDEEFEIVKQHPMDGVRVLESALDLSPLVRAVIRDHHERLDGSGYPAGKTGDRLHEFARIAAIADVVDAVTSDRPYKTAAPPHVGLNIIAESVGTHFDPSLNDTLRRVMMPFPVGCEVTLDNDVVAVVVSVDPESPWTPCVRSKRPDGTVHERVVDLTARDSLRKVTAAA